MARRTTKTARKKAARQPQRVQGLGSPRRPRGAAKVFTSPPIAVGFASPRHRLTRADLEISYAHTAGH